MSPKTTRRVDHWKDPEAPKPTSRKSPQAFWSETSSAPSSCSGAPPTICGRYPTGGLKEGEAIRECGIRECLEETGLEIEVTGLVGVFTTPDHVIEYRKGKKVNEVRQPVNVCLHARRVGGELTTTDEAADIRWIEPRDRGAYDIHPALRRRIDHGQPDRRHAPRGLTATR